jgi:hypothetical protein
MDIDKSIRPTKEELSAAIYEFQRCIDSLFPWFPCSFKCCTSVQLGNFLVYCMLCLLRLTVIACHQSLGTGDDIFLEFSHYCRLLHCPS